MSQIDGYRLAERALSSRGYNIINERVIDRHGNKIYYTDKANFFYKHDARPWFKPNNISFRGAAVGVFAVYFRQYILPQQLNFLYYYKDQNMLYHADGFSRSAEKTHQNDGQEVYMYPFAKMERWDVLENQMTLI